MTQIKTFQIVFFLLAVSCFPVGFHTVHAMPFKRSNGIVTYKLTVDYKTVNFTGRDKKAIAINDSIPAPTLYFKEGEKAVIYVNNKMDVETSVHWHGILLPNFQDGVPYLTSPPIRPGKTHKFEFVLNQSPGTYWYHSHTGLQEQEGLYGAIVIEPKRKKINYNHDLVLVLSDWTNENPDAVLRSLKRGDEWYSIKKGSLQSLFDVVRQGALGAQLKLWRQRMPGMDISDIYYDAFLINGKMKQNYPQFKAGDILRVRLVNASASTYFWLTFGGKKPLLVSADGVNIQPVVIERLLHAVSETYDFILKIPSGKAIEFKATAQDGSGVATALIGKGDILKAPNIPKPDLIKAMKIMAKNHGKGHSDHNMRDRHKPHSKGHSDHNMKDRHKPHSKGHSDHNMKDRHKPHRIRGQDMKKARQTIPELGEPHKNHKSAPASNYAYLKAVRKTNFSKNIPVREIEMDLTGNMWRYVWSINGKTLSEVDKIKIHRGEITRILFNNKTMMHHPMHLHGHFFRVLNKNGDYSPLKYSVDVPPMSKVTIEFDSNKRGDWFFHCHVLYHMKGGMARILSYGDARDPRLKNYSLSHFVNADNHWFKWGEVSFMSNRSDVELTISNTRNKILFEGTLSWVDNRYNIHKNFEIESSYEYFLGDFFRVYGELDIENQTAGLVSGIKEVEASGRLGLRYLLPYFFDLDVGVDHKAEIQVSLDYELMILSRLEFFSEWTGIIDVSQFKNLSLEAIDYEWFFGLEYIMSQNFSLISSYDNRFSWGAGVHLKF